MKRIAIKIIPNAKKEEIIKEGENHYKIKVRAQAVEGRANEAMIKLLAEYFDVSKSQIKIVRGEFARNKIVEIEL
ncbi:MAG: hypothetical protein US71_C0016G0002 [Parcubacteria group bacterium GW2011_GWD2_38_12]|uniref:UPF0235 protein A2907_00735 n=1 Tax=Candidatus Azambacteria bacterium RIFCSPLOWO2_01_FULL_37_9 TaxID=1797297 RepID=A0A1F5C6W0_9BACT|nr:MAG: hypothetical protein US56_C0009G0001 [Candidatus Moranbacteria bacterium GW2011_GWF2_37_7]KKQ42166.1 MAG: hypothetical protein US61_C0031G0002 [Parcubacteria group bacterium GW2011_GWE2_37_8]KKQ51188.1 MAG: hypothetical protein US71_C0016G0002 [Parcubacteria group bacterium GW2011_GWD2_38_12]KKQ58503.1 MAG: hypothetical protein US79_C0006G0010 [Parcubacteria group bacterium GW2011_GWC1_38_17]KKQ59406.1 MAG: hypothetical protein US78_C0004G0002 [Parcubacteria group bacterium GW2011_GWD1_